MLYAQINFKNLDSTFLNNLQKRIVFGITDQGELIQQIEYLYNSSEIKEIKYDVWAGTEGRIINKINKAKFIECLPRNLNKETDLELIEGWVSDSLGNAYSVFEILKLLDNNRLNSGVTCKIERIETTLPFEKSIIIRLTFQNTFDENRILHIYAPRFRDKISATPLNGGLVTPLHLKTMEIGPNQIKSIDMNISEEIALLKQKEHLYLYIIYHLRNEGAYDRMISDFIDVN